ncbi:hypothetical protein Hanom_Chr10g00933711 [Helianthus anomalus]
MEVPVQSEFRMATPPTSPIHVSIPEVNVSTPQQPPKTVEEPGSTTKKIPSPTPQGSSQGFPKVPSNLDGGPTSLDDVGYISFFNDDNVEELAKMVAELQKAKAESEAKLKATKEKLKQVEAENVVLKNEMLAMNDQIKDVKAGNNALNEMIDELLVMNYDLNDANTRMSNANEIMQKEIEDLKADKENKSKQIEMLYAVIEDRLGINVHATYDDIEIRRAEAQRMEKKQKDVAKAAKDKGKDVEVNDDNALVLAQQFVLVSKAKSVSYSREDNARRTEVERRRLKAKEAKKDQTVVKENLDLLDDAQNEEVEDVHPQGESSGTKHSYAPKVIFLQHNVKEGDLVENWTRESMKEALGLNEEDKFTFDFEKDIEDNGLDGEYVFEKVDEADNFNDVVIEDGSDSDNEVPIYYAG